MRVLRALLGVAGVDDLYKDKWAYHTERCEWGRPIIWTRWVDCTCLGVKMWGGPRAAVAVTVAVLSVLRFIGEEESRGESTWVRLWLPHVHLWKS